jgi:ATP-dependent Clp protease adapter protein ClpS
MPAAITTTKVVIVKISHSVGVIVISFESNCGHGVDTLMNLQRCDVVLLNDDQTPMEFVVFCAGTFLWHD